MKEKNEKKNWELLLDFVENEWKLFESPLNINSSSGSGETGACKKNFHHQNILKKKNFVV